MTKESRSVRSIERDLAYWEKRDVGLTPKDTNCFNPDPIEFNDEQDVMEMTSSGLAVPARFVE